MLPAGLFLTGSLTDHSRLETLRIAFLTLTVSLSYFLATHIYS